MTKGTKLPISELLNAGHVTENCQIINSKKDCRLKKLPLELFYSVKFVLLEKIKYLVLFMETSFCGVERLKSHEAKFQSQIPNPTSLQKDVVNNTTTILVVVGSFHFQWYLSYGFLVEFGFKCEILKHLFGWGDGVLFLKYIFNKISRRIFCLGDGQGFLGEKFNFRKQSFS